MVATERTAAPEAKTVVCSKQWRIKSEIMEKQRNVTHALIAAGLFSPLSIIKIVTRARCVLDNSRSILLACCAVSMSGAQITRFKTLVRTLTLAPVRKLSADIFHKEASESSISSKRTILPAQGRCTPGSLAISFVIPVSSDLVMNVIVLAERMLPESWRKNNDIIR